MRCLGALLRPSRGAALGAAARSVASAADLGSHSSGGVGMSVSGEHTARSGSGVAAAAQAVVLQEPRTLCRAVVQASREGKRGKGTWKAHIRKAIEIRDQLSFKQVAIVIHSCANAGVDRAQLRGLLQGLEGRILEHLARGGGVELYNVYSILHGAVSAGYSNVEMNKMMKQAVLGQFQHMLETGQHNKPQGFIFEDLAGIMHAFAQMQVPLERAEAMLVHDLFMALYEKDASEASTISHRAFAISVNTLERLGCHTAELFRVASGHLRRHIDAMCSIKDLAMVYCAAARTHAALFAAEEREECVVGGATRGTVVGEQSRRREASGEATSSDTWEGSGDYVVEQLRGCLQTRGNVPVGHITPLTALVLDRLTQPGKMAGGDEIDAQSIANIAAHAAVHVEGGDLQKRFREFVSSAVTRVMQNTDVDHTSLVHLMKCAIRANLVQEATLMLGAKHVYTVGMLAAPLEFAQHVANVNALRGQQSDSKVLEVLDSVAVTNMLQFHRRLLMPPVTVKPQPRRRRTLRDLIEAACQRETPSEPICIYNELDKCYKGGDGLRMCAKTIAAVSGFSGHKAAVDIAQKMVEYMEHMCVSGAVLRDMESVAAVATALSRFRMKEERLLRRMAVEVTPQLRATTHAAAAVQMLVAYAKLGCPVNRDIARGLVASPGTMRTTRSEKWRRARGPYERLFFEALGRITMADVLGRLNAQATVNCVFAVTLTGLGHRMPLFLYRLLVKLRRGWPSGVGCVEMDKQVKTVVLILERSGSRYNRGIRNEVKRLGKMWRERTGEVASVERLEGRVIGTRQPMLSGEWSRSRIGAIAGLHREVWRHVVRASGGAAVRSEEPSAKGVYYTDLVVKLGVVETHIEVDGPTHFFHATHEAVPTSQLKHAVLKAQGRRVVHAPYYGWQRALELLKLNHKVDRKWDRGNGTRLGKLRVPDVA